MLILRDPSSSEGSIASPLPSWHNDHKASYTSINQIVAMQ
jgi:hypothetical protein